VDGYANDVNAQLVVFDSERYCPGTIGIDAIAFN
jgi:hypothetical protein